MRDVLTYILLICIILFFIIIGVNNNYNNTFKYCWTLSILCFDNLMAQYFALLYLTVLKLSAYPTCLYLTICFGMSLLFTVIIITIILYFFKLKN